MSNTVFVVKNQHDLYLSKQQEWVDGTDTQSLYRTRHRDEALNTVFEVSSRDIYLRAESVVCELDAKANPILATAAKPTSTTSPAIDLDEPESQEPEVPETIEGEAAAAVEDVDLAVEDVGSVGEDAGLVVAEAVDHESP